MQIDETDLVVRVYRGKKEKAKSIYGVTKVLKELGCKLNMILVPHSVKKVI